MQNENFKNEIDIINQIINLTNKINYEQLILLRDELEDQRIDYIKKRYINDYATTYLKKNEILNLHRKMIYNLFSFKLFINDFNSDKNVNNINLQILKDENYLTFDF